MHIFLPRVLNENFSIFIIVFFEFFGTFLYAYLNFSVLNAKAEAKTEFEKLLMFYIDFSLSLFICVAYGRSFSGGVYNPATTFFRMLRRTDRLTVKMGMIYMAAQFLGASLGSIIGTCLYHSSYGALRYPARANHRPPFLALTNHTIFRRSILHLYPDLYGTDDG